jgi:hypothetical protein
MQQNELSIFAQVVSMVAEREKQQHNADQEQCYANTIRSLDTDIGYRHHAPKQNGLTPISRLFGLPQEPRFLARSTNLYDFFITFSLALSYKATRVPQACRKHTKEGGIEFLAWMDAREPKTLCSAQYWRNY